MWLADHGVSDREWGRQSVAGKPQGAAERYLLKTSTGTSFQDWAVWFVSWN